MGLCYEIALGGVKNRNVLMPIEEWNDKIDIARRDDLELYRSYYAYEEEEIRSHFKTYKTVKSFKGNFYLLEMIIDIDKGLNTDEWVLEKARGFIHSLTEEFNLYHECFQCFYSGRGYHFHLPNVFQLKPSNQLPLMLKLNFEHYFKGADTMPLMTTGLIRAEHTINTKSNRYKTGFTANEIYHLDHTQIMKIAEQGDKRIFPIMEDEIDTEKFKPIELKPIEERKHQPTGELTPYITCTQKMHNAGAVEGKRHERMLRMASVYRRGGQTQNSIFDTLKAFAPSVEDREIKDIIKGVYGRPYEFGCDDPVMKEFCDPMCLHSKKKNYMPQFETAESMEKDYVEWTRSDKTNKSFNFKTVIPIQGDFWFYPGEFNLIIGDTKIGKTALAENIAIKLKNLKIDYLCLEITSKLLYRRNVQIEHNMTKEQVDYHYRNNTNSLSRGLKHINVLAAPPDLVDLESFIKKRRPGLVIIDTLDGISVGKLESFKNREEKLAVTMKNIAQQNDTIIIGIHHVPKSAIRDDKGRRKKLTLHSGKGDSSLEQKADKILAIEGEQRHELKVITVLGARDEEVFKVSAKMNKDTFRIIKLADLPIDDD